MDIVKRDGFYYLRNSFRKHGKPAHKEKYLGKSVPENIEEIRQAFLRSCFEEDLFKRIASIQKNHAKEWSQLPESIKKKRLLQFAIEFTYNSNAIEGSTLTLEETRELIEHSIGPHRPLSDIKETEAHVKAFFSVMQENKRLTKAMLLSWHKMLFDDTKSDIAGKLREYSVRVGTYRAPDWQDVDALLQQMLRWYEKNKNVAHPVELAARMHYRFEKIHPFGDGNGRVGRLLIMYILRQKHYPLLGIEYKNRKSYYRALGKEEDDFVRYVIQRYIKFYNRYI